MCISSHSFQGTHFQGVSSPPVSTLPLLEQPSCLGSFCFTPSGEMDPQIRDESLDPGHRGRGGGRGSSTQHLLCKRMSSAGSATPLRAGKCSEERVGTCLGREVILGMDKEDFCLTHWRQKYRCGACLQESPRPRAVPITPLSSSLTGTMLQLGLSRGFVVMKPILWILAQESSGHDGAA